MTPCTEEAHRLLGIAQRDFDTFKILAAHPDAALSAMCFHIQQCIEKPLKAVLTVNGVDFPYTHNLELLGYEIENLDLGIPFPPEELRRLNPFAVAVRYDDGEIPLLPRDIIETFATTILDWARPLVNSGQ